MILIFVITAGAVNAQPRKAVFVGGGDPSRGKCTVEVFVDGAAQVEVRGDSANLRNLNGQAPQWRRFECTSAMPANPADFRFAGVDGRGRQTLVRDPRNNGGAAVVQIEDSDSGAEGYTFDLFWGGGPAYSGGIQGGRGPGGPVGPDRGPDNRDNRYNGDNRDNGGFRPPDDRQYDNRGGDFRRDRRMTEAQAMDVCRQSVHDQAADRFRTANVDLRNIAADNNPGRQDWITGDIVVRRRFGRDQLYHFSCSVNFDTGVVRSSHIDQFEQGYYPGRR
ncbi:MAG TPA: hypothetical protein VGQ49_25390 [Bryobacteraceae bacterium]|nr:hypothetical protein [Bryobacteraceae bacterium]